MSQSRFIGKGGAEGSKGMSGLKMKIKIPYFDNSALIAGYSKTVIGRCMNPRLQDMKALLFMFPRIWQLEGRVVGADLGLGRFQFDFDHEEDIVEVLKMEPFHFDLWMLSMVRWKPSVDPAYPSLIRFWIRVLGIPIEYWAEPTFKGIGEALGSDVVVDLDGGRIQVTLDGFKPLVFESSLEFGGGEETSVSFRYERLFGFCKVCHSLRHDSSICPQVVGEGSGDTPDLPPEEGDRKQVLSYKTAVSQDKRNSGYTEGKQGGGPKGKASIGYSGAEGRKHFKSFGKGGARGRSGQTFGEGSSRPRWNNSYSQAQNNRFIRADQRGQPQQNNDAAPRDLEDEVTSDLRNDKEKNKVQKALFQGEQQRVFEDDKEVPASQDNVVAVGTVHNTDVSAHEEVMAVESGEALRAAEAISDSLIPSFLPNEGTAESFTSLLAEVEASLPLMGNHEEGELLDDQVLTDHVEDNDNVSTDHFSELALLDVDLSGFDTLEELVNPMVENGNIGVTECNMGAATVLEKGKGIVQLPVKKKGVKGGTGLLKGVSSRKRLIQALTTPRKRVLAKADPGMRLGEGSQPMNQGTEKGATGGNNPPNSKI